MGALFERSHLVISRPYLCETFSLSLERLSHPDGSDILEHQTLP